MKSFTIFLVVHALFFFLYACEKNSDKKYKEYYYRNTSILRSRMEIQKKRYNGTGIEYYRNGKIKSQGQYIQNWRNGKHLFYYESGKLQKEEYYSHGALDGVSRTFNESGNKLSIGNYKQGNLNGTLLSYYDNGQLFQSFIFKDGKKNGPQKIYYKTGQLKSISQFKDGFPGLGLLEYKEDGSLIQQEGAIQIEEKNMIDLDFTYLIKCRITPSRKAKFFIDENKGTSFLSASLYELPCAKQVCTHALKIYPGEFVMTTLHIFAVTKSKQGNELVISKVINIAAGS